MLKQFKEEFIRAKITFDQRLLLAVSGGVDSMVLWHLVHSTRKLHGVAHVNYSLRGDDSDKDELLVKKQAKEWGIPFYSIKIDTVSYAKEKKLSVQMAAREIRYNFFKEIKEKHQFDVLATAHHLEDNIETFLINLNRGTSLKGLNGINSNQQKFRPLLTFTKKEILNYAKNNEVTFREDKSNLDIKYERNWFRHKVVAPWKELNPELLQRMKFNFERLKEANEIVEKYISEQAEELEKQKAEGYLIIEDVLRLEKPVLTLHHLLYPLGYNMHQVQKLFSCLQRKRVGKVFYSDKHSLQVDRSKIFVIDGKSIQPIQEYWLIDEVCKIKSPINLRSRRTEKFNIKFSKTKRKELFDFSKLSFPLVLRRWKEGDKMQPLGMKGKKKISDILIDEKIPLIDKYKTFVLTSDNEIVWLVGIKTDERFKISEETQRAIQFSIKK